MEISCGESLMSTIKGELYLSSYQMGNLPDLQAPSDSPEIEGPGSTNRRVLLIEETGFPTGGGRAAHSQEGGPP